ncbi:MAG TPA: hypothetical protein VNY27_07055 [Solirubrobacteraceae bacterium]|jgi:hypothetical protein|nr:hypothetical protein [Solirubrobacteraceae bacterium]
MKVTHVAWAAAIVAISLIIAVPLIIRAVHALLMPTVVAVGLYVVVRIVNARLNRW